MSRLGRILACVAIASTLASAVSAQTTTTPRPTPEQFASDASFTGPTLSPNGRYVAGIRQEGLIDELVVIDLTTKQTAVVQRANESAGVQIDWVRWKNDDRLIIGTLNRAVFEGTERGSAARFGGRDNETEEYWISRVVSSPRAGGAAVAMFNGQAQRLAVKFAPTQFVSALPNDPENILLSAYGSQGLTLWKTNINTGAALKVEDGGWDTVGFVIDAAGSAVMRFEALPRNSGIRYFRRAPGDRSWTKFLELKRADATNSKEFIPFAATAEPGKIYVAARQSGDLASIHTFDTATGQYSPALISHPRSDIDYAMVDSTSHTLLAGCTAFQRLECVAPDPAVRRHIRAVNQFFGNASNITVLQMSADQKVWLLAVEEPGAPLAYFTYDREAARVDALVTTRSYFHGMTFPKQDVVNYTSRDGAALWGYVTNAPAAGAPAKALVVMPHGGPEARDEPGFDSWAQFLASRGYVVFQPNFRGGDGFGRAFAEAGHRQWGKRMQDDITDGVKHLIATGAVDPARVCIFGWSYGGYAALAGGALTPELYRCVISGAGPSDLLEMLEYEREEDGRGSATYAYWKKAIGDPSVDREAIIAASPRRLAASFRAPVLLLHGDDDSIVPVQQSRMMDSALRNAGKSVRLVEFKDEDHGLIKYSSNVQFYKELDTFLAQNLPPN